MPLGNHLMVLVPNPISFSLSRIIECETVSKAFFMSRKTRKVGYDLLILSYTSHNNAEIDD